MKLRPFPVLAPFWGRPQNVIPPKWCSFFVSYIAILGYYFWRFIAIYWLITLLIIVVIKWEICNLFLSYGILKEFENKNFKGLYPSFANDMYAR